MAEVWVTMRSCSECLRRHDPDGDLRDCDCWCHDGDDIDDHDADSIDDEPYCVTPGCNCCGDDDE